MEQSFSYIQNHIKHYVPIVICWWSYWDGYTSNSTQSELKKAFFVTGLSDVTGYWARLLQFLLARSVLSNLRHVTANKYFFDQMYFFTWLLLRCFITYLLVNIILSLIFFHSSNWQMTFRPFLPKHFFFLHHTAASDFRNNDPTQPFLPLFEVISSRDDVRSKDRYSVSGCWCKYTQHTIFRSPSTTAISVNMPHWDRTGLTSVSLQRPSDRRWLYTNVSDRCVIDVDGMCYLGQFCAISVWTRYVDGTGNSKVKVMGVVKGQGHTIGPASYQLTSFSFHSNQTNNSADRAILKFDLETSKVMSEVKGQGHILYPVSNQCNSFLFHINRTFHSWDMAKNNVWPWKNTSETFKKNLPK